MTPPVPAALGIVWTYSVAPMASSLQSNVCAMRCRATPTTAFSIAAAWLVLAALVSRTPALSMALLPPASINADTRSTGRASVVSTAHTRRSTAAALSAYIERSQRTELRLFPDIYKDAERRML